MRIKLHIFLIVSLALFLSTSCKSSFHRVTNDVHWVFGRAYPFFVPIEQTNFETNFFDCVDEMIQSGLRNKFKGQEGVSIDPIAMWIVFSYPTETHLEIETRMNEEVSDISGWILNSNGLLQDSHSTNKLHSIIGRQKTSSLHEVTANLMMLLRIRAVSFTNLARIELVCSWHDGKLENRGLRLMREAAR